MKTIVVTEKVNYTFEEVVRLEENGSFVFLNSEDDAAIAAFPISEIKAIYTKSEDEK